MKDLIKKLTLVLIDADLKPGEVLVLHETIKLLKGFADQESPLAEASEGVRAQYKDSGEFEIEVMLDSFESFNAQRIYELTRDERAPIEEVILDRIANKLKLRPAHGYRVLHAINAGLTGHHLKISWEKL